MASPFHGPGGFDPSAAFEPRGSTTARADIHLWDKSSGTAVNFSQLYMASSGGDTIATGTGLFTKIGTTKTDVGALYRRIGFVGITLFNGSTTVTEGEGANFYVTAVGSGLHFEWRKNGTPISGAPDSYNYSFTASMGSAGTYSVRVYNAYESVVSSNITLTVEAYVEPPSIISTSGAGSYAEGSTISLSVTATGDSLNYEWLKGGSAISGAPNSSSYSTTAVAGDSATYSVRVYNSANSVESGGISVVVTSASHSPSITSFSVSPTNPHVLDTVTVSIAASDSDGDMTTLEIGFYKNEPAMDWVTVYNGAVPNASSFSTTYSFEIPLGTSVAYGGKFTAYVVDAASHSDTDFYTVGINP